MQDKSISRHPGTPCWIWPHAKNKGGYGVKWNPATKKVDSAYRMVFEALKGPVPPGLHLDHLCENPSCVNPDHLEPVTHTENIRRGKHVKLSMEKAREIRAAHLLGYTTHQMGLLYGVNPEAIRLVINGVTWREGK